MPSGRVIKEQPIHVLILRANGFAFDVEGDEADRFMVTLASLDAEGNATYTREEVEEWIRKNTRRLDGLI